MLLTLTRVEEVVVQQGREGPGVVGDDAGHEDAEDERGVAAQSRRFAGDEQRAVNYRAMVAIAPMVIGLES